MSDGLYSFDEACEKLGKTEDELRKLIEMGVLQEVQQTDSVELRITDVDRLEEAVSPPEADDDDDNEPAMAGFLDLDHEPEPEEPQDNPVEEIEQETPEVTTPPPVQVEPARLGVNPAYRMDRISLWKRFWRGFRDDRIIAVFLFGIVLLGILSACALGLFLLLKEL